MRLKSIVACLFIVNLTFSNAIADTSSPEITVKTVIGMIKEKGDPSPIVDYVDWKESFNSLPEKNRKIMEVESEDDLREFYRKILLSPAKEIVRVFETKFKDKIAEEKVESVIETVKQRALVKEEEIRKRIKESEYDVGKPEVSGTTALVPLTYRYGSESKTDSIKMIKTNDQWMIAGLGGFSFNSEAKK